MEWIYWYKAYWSVQCYRYVSNQEDVTHGMDFPPVWGDVRPTNQEDVNIFNQTSPQHGPHGNTCCVSVSCSVLHHCWLHAQMTSTL